MTPLTGRSDIGEGSPPGPHHPGMSRGLMLPQESLRTGTDKPWGHQNHGLPAGCYAPLTLPTLPPKSPISSPSQLSPRTKPQQLHKPDRPAAPTASPAQGGITEVGGERR